MSPSINANKKQQQQRIIKIGAAATLTITFDYRFYYVLQFYVIKQVSKEKNNFKNISLIIVKVLIKSK